MNKKLYFSNVLAVVLLALIFTLSASDAFARDDRGGHHNEVVRVGHDRYQYRDGRFYRSSFFGFSFSVVSPPLGAVVTTLPYGHRSVIVGGNPYYYYDDVYYRPCSTGYVVVQAPVSSSNLVYMSSAQPSTERETVTINVPTSSSNYIAITLVRYPNGFVGPQGEFYYSLPTAQQLRLVTAGNYFLASHSHYVYNK